MINVMFVSQLQINYPVYRSKYNAVFTNLINQYYIILAQETHFWCIHPKEKKHQQQQEYHGNPGNDILCYFYTSIEGEWLQFVPVL